MAHVRILVLGAALVGLVQAAPSGARPVTHVAGVVLSTDPAVRTLYLADRAGGVYLVLGTRVFAVGTRVSVSGTLQTDGWTVLAAERGNHVTRTGSASRVEVRGQLGFVDVARSRFQLGAHGQVVAEVQFPRSLGPGLVRMSALTPNHTRSFALAVDHGSLHLRSLPR